MLTLESLCIEQGDFRLTANFSIPARSNVAIIGASGAGKSTLLSVIAGFFAPTSGRVLWEGKDITHADPGVRPLSIVFQDNNLFPHLTAFQNAGLGLKPSLKLTPEDRERITASLHRVGLKGFEDRKPGALSGGQQSRVALARVLLRARPLLLLDEPFAALGPALKTDMLEMVGELAEETGATVLMVTHDPRDARRFADQTVLIAKGQAMPPQNTGELLDNPPPTLRDYLI